MAYTTINDPSAYSTITLYTGNGQDNRAVTNSANSGNFKPDWLWIKERSSTSSHRLFDSSRGASKRIESDTNSPEATDTSNQKSFDTNGFTLGTSGSVNANNDTYVAWQWKANGGTTASNSSGNITSTVQANTTAGFSIVTYEGNGSSNQTVGHGLGATPECLIWKNYDQARSGWNWKVWHKGLSGTNYLILNNANAQASSNGDIDALPTSTLFTVGTNGSTNDNGYDIICYAFTSIKGYSKFGSFIGNGNADGPFIYTGFKPAFIMYKVFSTSEDWLMFDSKRIHSGTNLDYLEPNTSDAEGHINVGLFSNGFKIREASGAKFNNSGSTYVYLAFAENPLVATNNVASLAG